MKNQIESLIFKGVYHVEDIKMKKIKVDQLNTYMVEYYKDKVQDLNLITMLPNNFLRVGSIRVKPKDLLNPISNN